MTAIGPFKIAAVEPGVADVVDRRTNRRVGYVLQDYQGNWEARCGDYYVGDKREFRRDAAWDVWNHRPRTVKDTVPL